MSSSNFRQQQQNNPPIITLDSLSTLQSSQMSIRPRLNIPPDYVEVLPGNFREVPEYNKKKQVWRLYVKEPDLNNGLIRKYSKQMIKNREKWVCTGCNTRRSTVSKKNKGFAGDKLYERRNPQSKEAKYDRSRNELYVSKNHASSLCKPFTISHYEWQILMADDSKPNIEAMDETANNNNTITFEMPWLSSPLLPLDASHPSSMVSTHDIPLADQLTNIITSSIPCSSRRILYSTNAEKNIPRSDTHQFNGMQNKSSFPPRSIQPTVIPAETIVTNPENNILRSDPFRYINMRNLSSIPSKSAMPAESRNLSSMPVETNVTNPEAFQPKPPAAVAEVIVPPESLKSSSPPIFNVAQRFSIDLDIITEGSGNDDVENEEVENLRDLSVLSIPDDPVTIELIQTKTEEITNSQLEIGENIPDFGEIDEEMEMEEKYDRRQILFTFSSPVGKTKFACRKLEHLTFDRDELFKFWVTVDIESVTSESSNIVSGERMNGFECLALMFTGSKTKDYELHAKVNLKLENDSIMKAQYDLPQLYKMSHTFCEEHFKLIARWTSWKIGVYENGILKKYGVWNGQDNDMVILIEKHGDLYAPVLEIY